SPSAQLLRLSRYTSTLLLSAVWSTNRSSFFFLHTRLTPRSTLFPYTTLFRSAIDIEAEMPELSKEAEIDLVGARHPLLLINDSRSEEHTSELQSRENLVCRLLLEKKKKHLTKARQ